MEHRAPRGWGRKRAEAAAARRGGRGGGSRFPHLKKEDAQGRRPRRTLRSLLAGADGVPAAGAAAATRERRRAGAGEFLQAPAAPWRQNRRKSGGGAAGCAVRGGDEEEAAARRSAAAACAYHQRAERGNNGEEDEATKEEANLTTVAPWRRRKRAGGAARFCLPISGDRAPCMQQQPHRRRLLYVSLNVAHPPTAVSGKRPPHTTNARAVTITPWLLQHPSCPQKKKRRRQQQPQVACRRAARRARRHTSLQHSRERTETVVSGNEWKRALCVEVLCGARPRRWMTGSRLAPGKLPEAQRLFVLSTVCSAPHLLASGTRRLRPPTGSQAQTAPAASPQRRASVVSARRGTRAGAAADGADGAGSNGQMLFIERRRRRTARGAADDAFPSLAAPASSARLDRQLRRRRRCISARLCSPSSCCCASRCASSGQHKVRELVLPNRVASCAERGRRQAARRP